MIIGDTTRPRHYCEKCGAVEYCDAHARARFPHNAARNALKNRHKDCDGKMEYACGVRAGPRGLTLDLGMW